MPFERCEGPRNIQPKKAEDVLDHMPFLGFEIKTTPTRIDAYITHQTEGLEPLVMKGSDEKTPEQTREVTVFNAIAEASGLKKNSIHLLKHEMTENGVVINLLDQEGTVWEATSTTFEEAAVKGLAAVYLTT